MTDPRRRLAIFHAFALSSVAVLGCDVFPSMWAADPPERVIFIMVDTLRRDFLSSYGSKNPTPNIDALAQRGQLFTHFTASFHQTSMSMGSLFTGRTPSLELNRLDNPLFWNSVTWCGLSRFAQKGEEAMCIPPSVPTLAESIRDAGYWTIGVVANHFLFEPSGFSRGFDEWVEVGEKPKSDGPLARFKLRDASHTRFASLVNHAAIEAINRRPSDRIFLYVHYMDVHDYGGRGVSYAKAVSIVDKGIGRLLGALDAAGLVDDAVVIVTSDHGERLDEVHALEGRWGHMGNPTFQELLEVPLIIAPATDRNPSAFLRTQDLFHVILEIVGLESEPAAEIDADELFLTETSWRTYLRGRWKSTIRREDGTLYLFDLKSDPREKHDVAAAHPDVAAALRSRTERLAEVLSARQAVVERLSEEDRERLRALGYLERLEHPERRGPDRAANPRE